MPWICVGVQGRERTLVDGTSRRTIPLCPVLLFVLVLPRAKADAPREGGRFHF